MIGRVVSVMAAAVADVRPGEHALRQALKLVRANRSIVRFRDDVEASRRWRQRCAVRSPLGCWIPTDALRWPAGKAELSLLAACTAASSDRPVLLILPKQPSLRVVDA